MNYLSICAIAKNEGQYIYEWCKYHLALGVDHIYLYDNGNKDTTVAEAIRACGSKVTIYSLPGSSMQFTAYNHCLNNYRDATRWLSFLDVDEFIVPKKYNNIPETLIAYQQYSALCIHWRLYGSSGHEKYSSLPVTLRFTKCANEIDRHVKSIVDPKRTIRLVTAHKFVHEGKAVDENFVFIDDLESRPENPTANIIQINHYVTKSKEEAMFRRSYPRADTGELRKFDEFFPAHDRNEAIDKTAYNFYSDILKQ